MSIVNIPSWTLNQNKQQEPPSINAEYVHMTLPNGEGVCFKREWAGYRFTDHEVALLMAGHDIQITTSTVDGITGSLDWQEYEGVDYFGFAPWDASAYRRENAPFPIQWNRHVFTPEEREWLQQGEKLLVLCESNRNGSPYAVHVSFDFIPEDDSYPARWGIIPHFNEFHQSADSFTRETCVFLPLFSGKELSLQDIQRLRAGETIRFSGRDKKGHPLQCRLTLECQLNKGRWVLVPHF